MAVRAKDDLRRSPNISKRHGIREGRRGANFGGGREGAQNFPLPAICGFFSPRKLARYARP